MELLKAREIRGCAVSSMYAMRRANGDWFALDDDGRFRVPVFRSSRDAMLARVVNQGMMLFTPAEIDRRALDDLLHTGGDAEVYFWLVDEPFTSLKRGQSIDHTRLAMLVRGPGKQQPTP